jgi:hypothetical protein
VTINGTDMYKDEELDYYCKDLVQLVAGMLVLDMITRGGKKLSCGD